MEAMQIITEVLARLDEEPLREGELLEQARRTTITPDVIEQWRRAWPTDKLPVVGTYFCVRRLGQGASGVVYQALDLGAAPRFVALKLLRPIAEEEKSRFFDREVEILKALACPHVARYLDSGSVAGTHYLAMELIVGVPLDEYFAARSASLDEKLAVFQQVCAAVADVHAQGVIHRDLKPQHVLVSETGEPYIVDFGLSAVRSEDWPTEIRKTQTRLGRIMGTIKYMSPEQAWGGVFKTDYRADIWALGVMLYEIVTDGDYPYELRPLEGMTEADALLYRIQSEAPKKPHIRAPAYASALTTLIQRCLVHEPHRRLDSARQLADDLARCRTRRAIATRPLPLHYRVLRIAIGLALTSRPALWAMTVFGALVVVAVMATMLRAGYRVSEPGLSVETRKRLIVAEKQRGPLEFLLLGMGDETYDAVPAFAASNGLPGVTGDRRTWRAVHGRLMERLAACRPRAVVWDMYFPSRQAGDAGFVAGVQALAAVRTPVIVAATDYDSNGAPALSPDILEPLQDVLRYGIIKARNMVDRPGEFAMALRRGAHVHAALPLMAFGALCYPDELSEVYWVGRDKSLDLRYRRPGSTDYRPEVDHIALTIVFEHPRDEVGARKHDLLACKAFYLSPVEYWTARTVPYEDALRATDERLAALASDRVVIVIDTRRPRLFSDVDRHPVRYADGVVPDVPGGYLMADAIKGLNSQSYRMFEFPRITATTYVLVLGMAVVGCLIALPLAKRIPARRATTQKILPAALGAVGLAGLLLLAVSTTEVAVELEMGGGALCLAAGCALAIEFTRRRHMEAARAHL